jgi:hypothetical protein
MNWSIEKYLEAKYKIIKWINKEQTKVKKERNLHKRSKIEIICMEMEVEIALRRQDRSEEISRM